MSKPADCPNCGRPTASDDSPTAYADRHDPSFCSPFTSPSCWGDGNPGFFDDGRFPVGQGWDQIRFPKVDDENAYALEVTGDSMQPLYRDGDILIVSPNSAARKGDRVVLRTTDGEVMAKILMRRTAKTVELASLNPAHPNFVFPVDRIDWMARIVWASQ